MWHIRHLSLIFCKIFGTNISKNWRNVIWKYSNSFRLLDSANECVFWRAVKNQTFCFWCEDTTKLYYFLYRKWKIPEKCCKQQIQCNFFGSVFRWTKCILDWKPINHTRLVGTPPVKWDNDDVLDKKEIHDGEKIAKIAKTRETWKSLKNKYFQYGE